MTQLQSHRGRLATENRHQAGTLDAPLRPFYFFVVLWGPRFRDYFLEYCLPSLLSPKNIPALTNGRKNKFLIATRPEDWAAITATPIFRLLEEHIEPVYIEIPPCPADKTGCEHMGIGHKIATELAFADKAYGVMLTPDLLLSEGTVARLQEHAIAGKHVVLTAALRFGEEPFLGHLEASGAIPSGVSRRDTGTPLVISCRQMVAAAMNGLHSESLRYEWDAPYFTEFPVTCWWRVPDEDGMVLHTFSWAPFFLDYGAVERHDVSSLDNWTIDGDYVYKNFGDASNLHVVQDSDEMFLASWAPLEDRRFDLKPNPVFKHRIFGELAKGSALHSAFHSPVYDPLKRRIFFFPVRWHARSLNGTWRRVEERAYGTLRAYVSPPRGSKKRARVSQPTGSPPNAASASGRVTGLAGRAGREARNLMYKMSLYLPRIIYLAFTPLLIVFGFLFRVIVLIREIWPHRGTVIHRLGQMVRGDKWAMRRARTRINQATSYLVSRSTLGTSPMRELHEMSWRLPRFVLFCLKPFLIVFGFLFRFAVLARDIWRYRRAILHRLGQVARGDREATRRAVRRVRQFGAYLVNRSGPGAHP
ncbi:MAG: hypothetical protein IIA72_02950 [Proteobacteria bacterium]|nr:hypothetical protein [Pseudomonadota bacterium]